MFLEDNRFDEIVENCLVQFGFGIDGYDAYEGKKVHFCRRIGPGGEIHLSQPRKVLNVLGMCFKRLYRLNQNT